MEYASTHIIQYDDIGVSNPLPGDLWDKFLQAARIERQDLSDLPLDSGRPFVLIKQASMMIIGAPQQIPQLIEQESETPLPHDVVVEVNPSPERVDTWVAKEKEARTPVSNHDEMTNISRKLTYVVKDEAIRRARAHWSGRYSDITAIDGWSSNDGRQRTFLREENGFVNLYLEGFDEKCSILWSDGDLWYISPSLDKDYEVWAAKCIMYLEEMKDANKRKLTQGGSEDGRTTRKEEV